VVLSTGDATSDKRFLGTTLSKGSNLTPRRVLLLDGIDEDPKRGGEELNVASRRLSRSSCEGSLLTTAEVKSFWQLSTDVEVDVRFETYRSVAAVIFCKLFGLDTVVADLRMGWVLVNMGLLMMFIEMQGNHG
jgi:hypothetical protein